MLLVTVTYALPLVVGEHFGDTAAAVTAVVVTSLTTLFVVALDDGRTFLLYWVHLALLQNAVTGLWYTGLEEAVPLLVTEAKTVSLFIAILVYTSRLFEILKRAPWLPISLIIFLIGILINLKSLDASAVANLRNFLTPPAILLMAAAVAMRVGIAERRDFIYRLCACVAGWLSFGSVVSFAVGNSTWNAVFNVDALGGLNSLSEFTQFLGFDLPRVGGLLFEPINAGYLAASVLVVAVVLYLTRHGKPESCSGIGIAAICLGGGLALGLAAAKNGIMMAALLVCAWILLRRGWKPVSILVVSWIASFTATLGYATTVKGLSYLRGVWSNPVGLSGGESTSIHMAGFISGVQSLSENPMGVGIGSGGNFYRLFNPGISRLQWLESGAESSWGTLMYQAGIVGIIGLVIFLIAFAYHGGRLTAVLLGIWSGASIFTEAFFGPIAACIILISAGFTFTVAVNTRDSEESSLGRHSL